MAKASVREISRITGFSPATVSNALNRKRSVSEETAKVILECAQSLGYQQSTQLESIQFVLARKTGAILDESTFHPAVIEGVERQARRHGMSTSFVSLDFSDLDAVRPQVEGLIADPSAAIVLMGTELGEEDYALFANAAAHLIVLDGWSDRQYFDAVVIAKAPSAAEEAAEQFKPMLAKLKEALKDKAEDVRVTTRLVDSPACLVVQDDGMSTQLARMLKQAGQQAPETKPVLEVNAEHPLVKKLDGSVHFHDLAHILFDQALLAEGGLPEDPAAYVKRVNALLA